MPFDINIFKQHLLTANPGLSRIAPSSFDGLLSYLQTLGPGAGMTHLADIQARYGAIPFEKQQKYNNAAKYLKQSFPGLTDATPANPQMHYREFKIMFGPHGGQSNYPLRFYHVHELTWTSSNGNQASLNTVGTRESVSHRTDPKLPPFDSTVNSRIPMHFTQGATTNSGANVCSNFDDHSIGNPTLLVHRPLTTGSLIADQVYEYTPDGQNWYPIPGTKFELEKGVRMQNNRHIFYFRKQNAASNPNRFHFEVEYPIDPNPPAPIASIPVIPAGFAGAADIQQFASRVISRG